MAKIALLLCLAFLGVLAEGRDWRFESVKRIKRGYNNGGYGDSDGTYGRSEEQNASLSREGCSDEGRKYGDNSNSGSRELSYNKDGRNDNNRHGSRSISKASASASATAFNLNHKANL